MVNLRSKIVIALLVIDVLGIATNFKWADRRLAFAKFSCLSYLDSSQN